MRERERDGRRGKEVVDDGGDGDGSVIVTVTVEL
jgi:hypothetical protein